jgi:RNA chaperone Hfq
MTIFHCFQPHGSGAYMSFPRRNHFKRRHPDRPGRHHERSGRPADAHDLIQPEHTGSESAYLKSLIDSRAKVTVVLINGERLQGHIRYYDRYCFSIGPSAGPKIFIRKESVSYISEDQ